ncbi:MAG: SH3 domain-containing protein [Treponema sp.]|nr:SH3 domain-containing protein [Treponema sp.]
MAYLGDGEKVIIGIFVAVLVIFGTVTLRSQIKYNSFFAAFKSSSSKFTGYVDFTPPPVIETKDAVVTIDLNLRIGPSSDNTPIKVLKTGSIVKVISVENGWAKVYDETDREGYVANNLLRYLED